MLTITLNGKKIEVLTFRHWEGSRMVTVCGLHFPSDWEGSGWCFGVAVQHPKDSFDREFGEALAYKRAWESALGKLPPKEVWAQIRQARFEARKAQCLLPEETLIKLGVVPF